MYCVILVNRFFAARLILAVALFSFLGSAGIAQAQETHTLAVVRDGDSPYFQRAEELFLKELRTRANQSYELTVKEGYDGGHDPERIAQLLREALADPEVDMIYAAGMISSELAAHMPEAERTKPVMAGAVLFSDLRTHPLTADGSSAQPNYTLISEPNRVASDVQLLLRLTEAKTLHVPVDEIVFPEIAGVDQAREAFEKAFGVRIEFHPIPARPGAALSRIPKNARAVYVPIMARMSAEERRQFYEGLSSRGAVTVSMLGAEDVRLGAVAGLAPDNVQEVARLAALNAHLILLGSETTSLPVVLPVQDRLLVNAPAAQRANWSPSYEVMLEAELVGEFYKSDREKLTLQEAMQRAAEQNTGVLIAKEEEEIQRQETKLIGSNLLPEVSTDLSYQGSKTEIDAGGSPGGGQQIFFSPESGAIGGSSDFSNTEAFGAELKQVLFNDELFSSLKAQRKNEASTRLDTLSESLDAIDAAASAYLGYLEAEALYRIEKDNLRLTENSLQLARTRVDIGSAEPSEVYRWEQSAARGKATLIQRDSARQIQLIELNRVLALPRETEWRVEDIEIGEKESYFLDDQLVPLLNNRDEFSRFRTFLRWFSVENSPELASYDHALSAQGILLRQKQRSFAVPELAGVLSYDKTKLDTEGIDGLDQVTVGVQLSYTIFDGGGRRADVLKQKSEIRQLAARRQQAVEQIEVQALVAFEELASAFPNIKLSRISLESAQKNYDSTQEKYAQGAASILDLLDAQDTLQSQEQQAVSATYDYLDAVHGMQRAIAWFEYQKTPVEKQSMGELIQRFLNGAVPVEHQAASPVQEEAEEAVLDAEGNSPFAEDAKEESTKDEATETPRKKGWFPFLKNRKND